MNTNMRLSIFASAALLSLGLSGSGQSQQANMTFFVTSVGPGKGGELGGLAGADQHCQSLAQAVGAGNHTWRAYLSTNLAGGSVNARDRIGRGPWQNAHGAVGQQETHALQKKTLLSLPPAREPDVSFYPSCQRDVPNSLALRSAHSRYHRNRDALSKASATTSLFP